MFQGKKSFHHRICLRDNSGATLVFSYTTNPDGDWIRNATEYPTVTDQINVLGDIAPGAVIMQEVGLRLNALYAAGKEAELGLRDVSKRDELEEALDRLRDHAPGLYQPASKASSRLAFRRSIRRSAAKTRRHSWMRSRRWRTAAPRATCCRPPLLGRQNRKVGASYPIAFRQVGRRAQFVCSARRQTRAGTLFGVPPAFSSGAVVLIRAAASGIFFGWTSLKHAKV